MTVELPLGLPNIDPPKGGGSARAISDRFRANSASGTGTLELGLGLSAGRGGFGPTLALSYDSGSGNGICGLGWTCHPGSVLRKTSKGVPSYRDRGDIFLFTGGEDLVPDGVPVQRHEAGQGYSVQRYRPRVERAFVRIERWTIAGRPHVEHWRTHSPDDVRSIFGRTPSARIFDPADTTRVFEWLLEEQWDGRGSVIRYVYKADDHQGGAAKYMKRIFYGNATALIDPAAFLNAVPESDWRFEAVFDYGEHSDDRREETVAWSTRRDPFSRRRAGFEIRTQRLLERVLMFHHFGELGPNAVNDGVLVRSTALIYDADPIASKLIRAEQRGHRDGATLVAPPFELEYSRATWSDQSRVVVKHMLERHRSAEDVSWIDLDGEGLPGLLSATPEGFWYQRPEGQGELGPLRLVSKRPASLDLAGRHQLLDLQGDGRLDLVTLAPPFAGYFEQTGAYGGSGLRTGFEAFRALTSVPNLNYDDPNLRFFDVDGDGFSDIVMTEGDALTYYRSLGSKGFAGPYRVPISADEAAGPRVIFADNGRAVFTADMTGDGLQDLVRIEARRVCYWPNHGHGHFGARVTMANAPVLEIEDRFDAQRVRLADLTGSGYMDLVYLHADGVVAYLNEAGNGWSDGRTIRGLALPDRTSKVSVVDLLGRGTSCLVWTTRAADRAGVIAYVDLFGREDDQEAPPSAYKPNLLVRVRNNMGAETRIRYAPSTKFYLETRGTPNAWVTRLHFPVQVVDRVEHEDFISGVRCTQRFAYRDGYFDPDERELNGFGYVEQWDEETSDRTLGQVPPSYTRTWYHTGASRSRNALEAALLANTHSNPNGLVPLPPPILPSDLTAEEATDACRALRGQKLRQEIYGLDGSALEDRPYVITEAQVEVRRLVRGVAQRSSVFTVVPRETRTISSERDAQDARIVREIALELRPVDAQYGHVFRAAKIAFGRSAGPVAQTRSWSEISEVEVSHHDELGGVHRIRQTLRTRRWEALAPLISPEMPLEGLRSAINASATQLLSETETLYWNPARNAELPGGQSDPRGFVRRLRALAVPAMLANEVYAARPGYSAARWTAGGHEMRGGDVWSQTSSLHYLADDAFNLPELTVDPFGNTTRVSYDAHRLYAVHSENAAGHVRSATIDYQALAAREVVDANANHVEVAFDAFGAVTRVARKGKDLGAGIWEGRTLDAPHEIFTYARNEWMSFGRPSFVRAETFTSHDPLESTSLLSFTYADGDGRVALSKTQARPDADGSPRWVGSGRTVCNNKGDPLAQYEPYFSSTSGFDIDPALIFAGRPSLFHYDPLNRLTRTELPDGTELRLERFTWSEVAYDRSDLIVGSRWAENAMLSGNIELQRALALSLPHDATPATQHFDALGRVFRIDENNGNAAVPVWHTTTVLLDIEGRTLEVVDARNNVSSTTRYDLLGRALSGTTSDGGMRWMLPEVDGLPLQTWNQRLERFDHTYDRLRRPVSRSVTSVAGPAVRSFTVYGDVLGEPGARAANLLGRPYQTYDGAGVCTNVRADFDGNTLHSERRFRRAPADSAPLADWASHAHGADWSILLGQASAASLALAAEPLLEAEVFVERARYDACGRAVSQTGADGSTSSATYGEDARISRVEVAVRGAPSVAFLSRAEYDAQGRRVRADYGQAVLSRYDYDPESRRLRSIFSERGDGAVLQDLHYTCDAAGNIVAIVDGAQPTLYFDNAVVTADRRFEYDARNRLLRAEGRCHPGQQPLAVSPPSRNVPHANDDMTLQRYVESYRYDAVGNIMEIAHRRGANVAWRRRYQYALASNRLISTSASMAEPQRASYADPAFQPSYADIYAHDVHGNMTMMPGVGPNVWDADDRLVEAPLGGGGTAFYIYDDNGARARKIIRRANGAELVQRIYIGGWERFERRLNGASVEVIETLHVGDGETRLALVETRTRHEGVAVPNPEPRARYQLSDHAGTCTIEVDGTAAANVLSYEEFFPYGATAYRATRVGIELSPKRYRYTTKERDEETGLDYFGARYYASWLGRWCSADPSGAVDGPNLYQFVLSSPIGRTDADGQQSGEPVTIRQQAPDLSELTPGIHVHPHPDHDRRLVWVRMGATGIEEGAEFGFLREDQETALRQARGDERLAKLFIEASKQFNDYIEQSILLGKNPVDARQTWLDVNLGEAAVHGFFFGGDPSKMGSDEPSVGWSIAQLVPSFLGVFRSLRVQPYARTPRPRTQHENPRVNEDGSQLPDRDGLFDNLIPHDLPKPISYSILEKRGEGYVFRNGDSVVDAPSGSYQFVVLPNGQTRVAPRSKHVDLAEGGRVRYAGEVSFGPGSEGSRISRYSNASGHYRPVGSSAGAAGLNGDFADTARLFAFFRTSKVYRRSQL
jgi:RHS repeat-associated protein